MVRRAMLVLGLVVAVALPTSGAEWDAKSLDESSLLEFFTVNKEGEEHWATVYFVELDGDIYIRLGSPAETRIRENVNAPYVKIRVGDQVFEQIVAEETPDKIRDVADAIYNKYWTSLFIKLMPDRFTVRLRPE